MTKKIDTIKCCAKCKVDKSLDLFYYRKDSKEYRPACKQCISKDRREHRKTEQYKRVRDLYYSNPQVRDLKYKQHVEWRAKNRDKVRAYYRSSEYKEKKKKYYTDPLRGKPLFIARTAKRRAIKKQAAPKWLTNAQINEMADMYKQAKELEKIFFNRKFHVDHIIPLKGENVCGLHVPWNLQILTAEENLSKGNRYSKEG